MPYYYQFILIHTLKQPAILVKIKNNVNSHEGPVHPEERSDCLWN